MCLWCEKQIIKGTNRYSVLHYKSTTSNSLLPNVSIGSELAGATPWEVKLCFGLKYKLKIIIIIKNLSVTEGEKREVSGQISIKFDHWVIGHW